jgi:hypothetical protein
MTDTGYWRRPGIGDAIVDALRSAGKNLERLTVDDLAPLDHFHGGGIVATRTLARMLSPAPGTRVLDVGGGFRAGAAPRRRVRLRRHRGRPDRGLHQGR